MNPILHQLVRGLQAPKFDDTSENWPAFIWDFNAYLQRLSPIKKIEDAYKLHLFEDTMPASLKNEIKLMRKRSGGTLTFAQVAAKFEARYGSSASNKMRKKWQEISLPTAGKITTKHLREFQVSFLASADDVKDCTPQETRRLLLLKIPPFMKNWVVDYEQKMDLESPIIQMVTKDGLTPDDMARVITAWFGETPKKVTVLGRGTYHIHMGTHESAKKMLGLHMHEIQGFPRPLEVTHVEHALTSLQIFELLDRKLAAKEKVDSYNQPTETRNYARGVNATHTKSIGTSDEKTDFGSNYGGIMAPYVPPPPTLFMHRRPPKGGGHTYIVSIPHSPGSRNSCNKSFGLKIDPD